MHAVADIDRLVSDGVITTEQAKIIESRARETMVYMAINALLCFGIIAATGGLIFWLGTATSVAALGVVFLGLGLLILMRGNDMLRMFGNAAVLIGAGMLIGGASVELLDKYEDVAGPVMIVFGLIVLLAAVWFHKIGGASLHFVTGAIMVMGLGMHLTGIGYVLGREDLSGAPLSLFFLYAAMLIACVGWKIDVRLVTALAIVPFAQMLETGTFYFSSAYAFYSPESTLTIIQMAVLIVACMWIAARLSERTARHARVLAVMAFIVVNLCALVGSLWGDVVGEHVWGPGNMRDVSDISYAEWNEIRQTFRESAIIIHEGLYSVLWALALAALVLWAAHRGQRGLFIAALTFGGIDAYTQMFENFGDEPLAFVIGGLAAIPLAWGMWRLDHWISARNKVERAE